MSTDIIMLSEITETRSSLETTHAAVYTQNNCKSFSQILMTKVSILHTQYFVTYCIPNTGEEPGNKATQ